MLINTFIDYVNYTIGDWGLGIGDWAQSPIPNPQSPIFIYNTFIILYLYNILSKVNI